jgi:hypothetical protein
MTKAVSLRYILVLTDLMVFGGLGENSLEIFDDFGGNNDEDAFTL